MHVPLGQVHLCWLDSLLKEVELITALLIACDVYSRSVFSLFFSFLCHAQD